MRAAWYRPGTQLPGWVLILARNSHVIITRLGLYGISRSLLNRLGHRTDHGLTGMLVLAIASSVRSGRSSTAPMRKQIAPIRVWVPARPALCT